MFFLSLPFLFLFSLLATFCAALFTDISWGNAINIYTYYVHLIIHSHHSSETTEFIKSHFFGSREEQIATTISDSSYPDNFSVYSEQPSSFLGSTSPSRWFAIPLQVLRNMIAHSLCAICIWILWWSWTLCSWEQMTRWMTLKNFVLEDVETLCSNRMWHWGRVFVLIAWCYFILFYLIDLTKLFL